MNMSTSSREKQALGVFVVLIVLGFCGLCWYLVAGHSWNVAASAIDEKVGQMDGYTTIVYAGTVLPEVEPASASASSGSSPAQTANEGSSSASSANAQLLGSGSTAKTKSAASSSDVGEVRKDAASGSTADVDGIAAPVVPREKDDASETDDDDTASTAGKVASGGDNAAGMPSMQSSKDTEQADSSALSDSVQDDDETETTSEPGASGATDAETSSALDSESMAARSGLTAKSVDPVSPDDVCASYEGKGAQVLVLDTVHPSVYEDGAILKRGQKRIGVFSALVPLSEEAAQERVAYFKDANVDMIVCISSVRSYVRNASGIDIVITLQDDGVSTMGTNSNGTFYVNAPEIDTVGAILISPSNVVSAKVVESL